MDQNKEKISHKYVRWTSSLLPPQTLIQMETINIPGITVSGRGMVRLLLALLN
jgi:hypothetical protein